MKEATGQRPSSCLYIKKLEDVDMKVLTQLVKQSARHMRSQKS